MYSEKVVEYFMHPRNVGKIEDANGIGEVGNPVCGDVMKIYLKINDESHVIEKITFETFGCAAAIASSSMLTEIAKGKTLEEALKITNEDVLTALGGLPDPKIHCSLLAKEGMQAAAADYYLRKTGKLPEGLTIPENVKNANLVKFSGIEINNKENDEEYLGGANRLAD